MINKICIIPNAPNKGYKTSTNLEKPMGDMKMALILTAISQIW